MLNVDKSPVAARKKTGCKNFRIAKQIVTEEGIDFGAIEPIKDLEEFNYNYVYAEGSNYADNIQNIYKKKPIAIELGFTFSAINLTMEAKLMGKKYSKGGTSTNVNDQAQPVAVLFQETYDDGSYENVVIYNAKLYKNDNSGKSEAENIEFTSAQIVGRGLPFTNHIVEGELDFKMDSADATVDKVKLANFFNKVQYNDFWMYIDIVYEATGEITEISLEGVTYNTSEKAFIGVPRDTKTFTFKDNAVAKTATLADGIWSFAEVQ